MDQRSKIAILGFGVEGKAVFEYLKKHNYNNLTICDENVDLKDKMPEGVSVKLGEKYLDDLVDFEVLFRSPGIPFLDGRIQTAFSKGVEVTSATNFFMDQCPCPVASVTGTKGKGTTASLIYEMLKTGGRGEGGGMAPGVDVFLGGNIGNPPLEFLDKLKGDSVVVLELSSFQLQDSKKSPHYAVILNTTVDHLDYHADKDEYLQAKEQLLTHQTTKSLAVLNKDYEYSKYYVPLVKGKLMWVSRDSVVKDGAYVHKGMIYYAHGGKGTAGRRGKATLVASVKEVALIGSHNLENILPAVVISRELGVSFADIATVIRTFKNLPYRLQFSREVNGIRFYNDSYSTTPETSMAAVDSFEEPTVLIAGGYDKGLNYDEWALKILTKASLHTVILIGQTADKMEEALIEAEGKLGEAEGSPTKILRRKTLEDAVVDSYAESDEGGVVVLSPGAASFDMFKDYKERGNEFVAQVRKLK